MTKPALWTKHRPVAYRVASEWRIPGMDTEDVRQEALVSLWEAAGAYDPSRGRFPSFARMVIERRMTTLLRAATCLKRTAEFDRDTEPTGPDLETTVLHREQLTLFLADTTLIERRRRWRENKRRQRAAA